MRSISSVVVLTLAGALAAQAAMAQSAQSPASITAAVKAHDLAGVSSLLQKGADVNAADVDGTTALMMAVQDRNAGMLEVLLKAGANVDAANRYGATALHTAARNGDAEAAVQLLKAGANPNTALPEGETVLMSAARTGNVALIKALLAGSTAAGATAATKADPNYKEGWKGQTALMWAAAEGHAEAVTALVEGGALLNESSTEIVVPTVSPERRIGGFVYANIPKGKLTALHFAARGGHLDVVNVLAKAGADLNIVDADGANALVLATLNGHPDVAVSLIDAGADVNIADKYGRNVLFLAVDMNTLDANPRPAPMVTGEKTYLDVVQIALAKGANPNAKLKMNLPSWVAQGGQHNPVLREGATAFLRAAMSADLKSMDLLLKAGADHTLTNAFEKLKPYSEGGPDRENFGETTPLMAAAGVGWREEVSRGRDQDAIEAIKLLIAKGGNVNAVNNGGNTTLHGAAMRGSPKIVEFLLTQGADPTLRNARGLTPMDIARGVPEHRILPNEAVANALLQHAPAKLSNSR